MIIVSHNSDKRLCDRVGTNVLGGKGALNVNFKASPRRILREFQGKPNRFLQDQ